MPRCHAARRGSYFIYLVRLIKRPSITCQAHTHTQDSCACPSNNFDCPDINNNSSSSDRQLLATYIQPRSPYAQLNLLFDVLEGEIVIRPPPQLFSMSRRRLTPPTPQISLCYMDVWKVVRFTCSTLCLANQVFVWFV